MRDLQSSIKEVERLERLIKRNKIVRDKLVDDFHKGVLNREEHNKFVKAHNSVNRNTNKLNEAKVMVTFYENGGMSSLGSIIS